MLFGYNGRGNYFGIGTAPISILLWSINGMRCHVAILNMNIDIDI